MLTQLHPITLITITTTSPSTGPTDHSTDGLDGDPFFDHRPEASSLGDSDGHNVLSHR